MNAQKMRPLSSQVKKVTGLAISLAVFLFVPLGTGCVTTSKTTGATTPHDFTFPKNFLWGAATSSHQVEGNNTNNDWWEWEQTRVPQVRSGQACDHWNRFEEDFKLAEELGHTAHRFSIEWSRIHPQEGQWDSAALAHYARVIRSVRSKGMEPVVTLNHFTIPLWLARQGGWVAEKTPERFARYVDKVSETLRSDVRYWMTLNEPVVYVYKRYMVGERPPGKKSPKEAIEVFEHLKAVAQAMQEGAPVMGYLYWSLLDHYEWAEGFVPRFGLIEINYTTQKRTVRGSAKKFAEIIRAGKLSL